MSDSGNDNNSGITPSAAWKSLSRVNTANFNPGDQILLQRGQTFYGSLTIRNSGASGRPIVLSAYGTGPNPIITGFTTVTDWVNVGTNLWESGNAVSTLSNCNMVAVNGINTAMGRFPNEDAANGGYLTFQSHSGNTSITSSSITNATNWTGAEAVVRSSRYTMDVVTIVSQSGGTLNFNTGVAYAPTDGWGFFIQNDARTLDRNGEWYFNPTTRRIRIYSTSRPTDVKAANIDNLLTINGNYVSVAGVNFSGANNNAIHSSLTTLTNIDIRDSTITFSGRTGIKLRSNGFNIIGNTVQYSNNRAMDIAYSRNALVSNNLIRDTGVLPGMAIKRGFDGIWGALYMADSVSSTAQYNTILNSGYSALLYGGTSSDLTTVNNNYIDTFCTILDDGGGIYGGRNSKIFNNIVLNGIGAPRGTSSSTGGPAVGIYLDDDSKGNEVINNTVANIGWTGIYLHNASYNTVRGNLVYNVGEQLLYVQDDGNTGTIDHNTITQNVLVARSGQYPAQYRFPNYYSMGTVDNNYYARPINERGIIRVTASNIAPTDFTLAGWQTYSGGLDANSRGAPRTIANDSELRFEYNATNTARTIPLSVPMIDMKGTRYPTSVTLQPFTSIVLIRE